MYFQSSVFRSHSVLLISQTDPLVFIGQGDWDSAVSFQNHLLITFCHCIQPSPQHPGMFLALLVTGLGSSSQIWKQEAAICISMSSLCFHWELLKRYPPNGQPRGRMIEKWVKEASILPFLTCNFSRYIQIGKNEMEHSVSSCNLGREKVLWNWERSSVENNWIKRHITAGRQTLGMGVGNEELV